MILRATHVVAVAAVALAGAACGSRGDGAAASDATPDTLRGVVSITGAEPVTRVALRTDSGAVVVTGPAAPALRGVSGLEVWVAGRHEDGARLHVDSFRVRALEGIPAVDGVLESAGEDVVLVTADGERVRFARAPRSLHDLAGRRVWIAGTPGGAPQQWGPIP